MREHFGGSSLRFIEWIDATLADSAAEQARPPIDPAGNVIVSTEKA